MCLLEFPDLSRYQVFKLHCLHEWLFSQDAIDVELVRSLEHHADVFVEVLVRVREGQKLQKLSVCEEEEAREISSSLIQIVVDLLLKATEVLDKVLENCHSAFDLEIISGLGLFKGAPHYSLELVSHVQEILSFLVNIPIVSIADSHGIVSENFSQMFR